MTTDIYAIDDVTYQSAIDWHKYYFSDQAIFQDDDGRLFCFALWTDFDKDDIAVERHYFDEYGDYKQEYNDVLVIYAE